MKSSLFTLIIAAGIASPLVFAADADTVTSDEILASRGEAVVTHTEFDAAIAHVPEAERAAFLRDSRRVERVIADLLTKKQLASQARQAHFDQDPVVRQRMENAATATLAEMWLDHRMKSAPEADYEQLAREHYLADPSRYMSEQTIDVSHILISTEERSEEEALARAQQIRAQLEEDPGAWDALVVSHSDDPAVVSNGGAYTSVKRGDMVPNFENTAFELSEGEISSPVQTQYGYHVIRLDGVNEARQLAFDEVRERLIEQQRRRHQNRVRDAVLNEVGSHPTEMTNEALLKMLSRYFDEEALNLPESE
ncbi:MAG: peptidylprolyl isomerase [Xanthomonadales bacterium]|nr:peptidylprolyl isomerase [Xanthomonadales bacterium]